LQFSKCLWSLPLNLVSTTHFFALQNKKIFFFFITLHNTLSTVGTCLLFHSFSFIYLSLILIPTEQMVRGTCLQWCSPVIPTYILNHSDIHALIIPVSSMNFKILFKINKKKICSQDYAAWREFILK
jgi:hypothetical protein